MSDHELPPALRDLLGVPAMSGEERTAVLDLVRVVAHTTERRYGPLVAYGLGLALSRSTDPAERATHLRTAIEAVQRTEEAQG
ncbi:DUF6457 domain-containing protein [Euzebya sp.]|uniref:DUF6457 domain-containing protein n=1 Tax=Euzebya sp. TaxID=1971409 RepID=UPI003518B128